MLSSLLPEHRYCKHVNGVVGLIVDAARNSAHSSSSELWHFGTKPSNKLTVTPSEKNSRLMSTIMLQYLYTWDTRKLRTKRIDNHKVWNFVANNLDICQTIQF